MVATLLRLRFRVLGNTLTRNPWQLVAVILGGCYVAGLVVVVAGSLIFLGATPSVEAIQATLVIGGSALTLGWILIPLLTTGVEQTLDARRLSPFPLRVRTLLLAQLLVGLTWIPGIATVLISVSSAIGWWQHPFGVVTAIACGLVGAVICIAASRVMALLTTSLIGGRGWAARLGIIVGVLAVVAGPVVVAVARGAAKPAEALVGVSSVLEWTPLGAIWSVAGALVGDEPLVALLRFAIGALTLGGLLLVWHWALRTAPNHSGRAIARAVGGGRLGAFSLFPASPAGAIAARSFTYWIRDPRYARQLVIVPLVPVLLFVYAGLGLPSVLPLLAGPIIAGLLPLTLYASISFDGTAYATELMSGARGIDDRIGRLLGVGVFAAPAVLVIAIVSCAVSGRWELLPTLLGLSIGMLLTGLAVTSVSSAFLVVPVPAAKDNPFSGAAGAGVTSLLGSFAVTGATLALGLPEIVLTVISLVTGNAVFGWITLVVGGLLGGLLLFLGLRIGGRLLDRNGPGMLLRLRRMRG